jgi:sialic acid synthase SpsE
MPSAERFEIEGVAIGREERPYVLAEIGINHGGDVSLAERMVQAAAEAGADGVKFQTFRAADLVNPEKAPDQYEIFSKCELDRKAHLRLRDVARAASVAFISTPFSERDADLLAEIGLPAIKIASGDLTNHPLLKHVGALGLPVILSTGMSYLEEVRAARDVLLSAGCPNLALLHCVSRYPTAPSELNLLAIGTMLQEFPEVIGFSDHTEGIWAAPAAVAVGARFIEKHFTLDRTLPGPDHALSVEPGQLALLVEAVRGVYEGLGDGEKKPCEEEVRKRHLGRKGLYASRDIAKGAVISRDDVKVSRPEGVIGAWALEVVLGKEACRAVKAGEEITWETVGVKDSDSVKLGGFWNTRGRA